MSYFLMRFCLTLLTCCSVIALVGQSFRALERAGDQAAESKDFYAAMHHYARGLAIRPDDLDLSYKYASMAMRFNAFEVAKTWYIKLREHPESSRYPLIWFHLGMAEKAVGNYEQAQQHFAEYLSKFGAGDPVYAQRAKDQMEQCAWAMQIMDTPDNIEIVRLGKQVNTGYSEFGPFALGDTLYFSALRFEYKNDKHTPKRMVSKILYSNNGSTAKPLRDAINLEDRHTAHVAISPSTRRIYYTRCEYVNASEIRCALYYRDPDKRGRWRGTEVKLPPPINIPEFTTTQPAIGFDSAAQAEILFFVSDRPGSSGGLDIWKVDIHSKGVFGNPEPLNAINTPGDDITPFFHQASQTLWFSTNGRNSLGGFDIYSSKKNAEWEMPQHAGSPLNTSYNDIYPMISPDGMSGYFASNRPGSLFLDADNKACCNDLYRFRQIPPQDSVALDSLQTDTINRSIQDAALNETPDKLPETLEDFLPLALYFDNDEPDRRTRRTSTSQSYLQTFERYYRQKSVYLENCATRLEGDAKSDAEERMDAFFEQEIGKGRDYLILFSQILLQRLEAGDQVEIFIKGFTSPRAQSDYNMALGARRISSLRNHFDTWEQGILQPYLQKGQLKVSERSFGETTASKEISDALDDLKGSVYSIGAMRERRVEIVEIKRTGKL